MAAAGQTDEPVKKGKTASSERRRRFLRLKPGPLRRAIILAVILIIVFGAGGILSRIWTNFLWFQEVGYTIIFWTPIWGRLVVGLFFAIIFFIVFYGSLWLARRISPRLMPVRGAEEGKVFELAAKRRWPGRLMLIISILAAIIIGVSYSSRWEEVFLFFGRSQFGYADPLFHKDASFFVFTLPLWKTLVNFTGLIMLFTFIATCFVYLLDRAMVLNERNRITLAPHVKAHLSVILAIAMLAKAADYMMQTWSLNLSQHGAVFGAGYTDVHARLPVLHFLAVVSLIAAGIFLANIRYRGWRLPALAIGLMFLTWVIAGRAYPAIIQQYRVSPNEITAESQYITNNIQATRFAFGLDNITTSSLTADNNLTAQDVNSNSGTINNIRLWEPRPALSTYSQIQEIRLYYVFKDVDVDRYTINGGYREVLLSARELDQTQLQTQSQTWVNQHLIYTHGYGFVMSPVNEAGSDGLPILFVKDIPPTTSTDLKITRPEIYYGELGNPFIVVKTKSPEFDYPRGDSNASVTYQGQGGVSIGGKLRQIAFSFRFGTLKLLFSSSLTGDSRIMFRRTIQERVQTLAPFLQYDKDPYLVLRDDGSLVWMWDAYTSTNRFPYSQPHGGVNYMRNPIKVVINAYDGKVTFYQIDPSDPVANAWGNVYHGLFTPGDQMPADLRAHMRYPEDFYTIQASVLTTYHMTDPQIFYNKEDVWEIPTELYNNEETPVLPYYEVMGLPGESKPEFALVQPFSPLSKKNMASILAARQDGANYGKLVLFDLPKDKLIFGPSQVEARISNDPVISSQLTLWDQAGSQVIRGNLLVVPIGQSLIYFEPLYLQAQQSPIPELTRVIVSYGDQVVMEPTVIEALTKIFGSQISGGTTTTTAGGTTSTTGGSTTTTSSSTTTTIVAPTTTVPSGPTTTLSTDAATLIAQANQYYQAALAAQKAGDWAEYGRQINLLGQVLEKLASLNR
ncbi:MAG: UPF0182 family protein [Actinobacteria bacterium]|nr:UPF0182 family protein [Actinomycetota bacterium]